MKLYIKIFVLFFFLSAPYMVEICSGYLNYLNLDKEQFLLWHYASLGKIIPYKDIFYPYGLLHYFRNYNLFFSVIYYSISPLLFTILFYIFSKKVFKITHLSLFFIFVFYYFILKIVGFETFSRYGIFIVSSLIFADILYSDKVLKLKLFGIGIFLGLVAFLIPDLGIYSLSIFVLLYITSQLIKSEKPSFLNLKNIFKSIIKIKFAFLGLLASSTPILILLLYKKQLTLLLDHYGEVRNITLVAKTPFFSFIDSPSNLFTLSVLFSSIFFILYKLFYLKRKVSLLSFFQITLIMNILILEQKSIVRSIDLSITFISLILLMLIIYEFIYAFRVSILNKKIFYFISILSSVILFGINVPQRELDINKIFTSINLSFSNKCFDSNLKKFLSSNAAYIKLIDLLKERNDFNNKIFSFPTGNSALYVLLNQKPPFYNAIFEGATNSNQKSSVEYIQENKVKYITLNTNRSSIQDGVPDYIRQPILFKYIINNYYPLDRIGNLMVLRKSGQDYFFNSDILKKIPEYRDYLLNVYLYKIPYSEGMYKYKYLEKNNELVIESKDINKINSFVEKNKTSSENKVIVLIPNVNYKSNSSNLIELQTYGGHITTIHLDSCKKNAPCIINLSNIPLFYKNQVIVRVILDKGFKGTIKIFKLIAQGDLW